MKRQIIRIRAREIERGKLRYMYIKREREIVVIRQTRRGPKLYNTKERHRYQNTPRTRNVKRKRERYCDSTSLIRCRVGVYHTICICSSRSSSR